MAFRSLSNRYPIRLAAASARLSSRDVRKADCNGEVLALETIVKGLNFIDLNERKIYNKGRDNVGVFCRPRFWIQFHNLDDINFIATNSHAPSFIRAHFSLMFKNSRFCKNSLG